MRLTMGGEPTFVSIDDMDGEEWNTAAMGPAKRRLGGALLTRVRDAFAPGGLLHFGQGKWYPGESLPRWAFACYWRTDGVPLWHDPSLVGSPDRDDGFDTDDARAFAEALAERLGVGPQYVIAAYEDPLTYIHKERELPVNVDPEHNDLDDPEERERLRKVFSRGLGTPTGFVLPLARAAGKDGPTWQSGLWMLRARHLFLIPGDSPVGLRLPLKSLPAGPAWEVYPIDPMLATWPDLAARSATAAALRGVATRRHGVRARHRQAQVDGPDGTARRQQQNGQHAPDPGSAVVRTALTRRSPRGQAVGVPAAGRVGGRLRGAGDRHRGHGRARWRCRCWSRAIRRPTIRGCSRSR